MQMTRGVELGVEEFGLDNTANICKNRIEWDSCSLENSELISQLSAYDIRVVKLCYLVTYMVHLPARYIAQIMPYSVLET